MNNWLESQIKKQSLIQFRFILWGKVHFFNQKTPHPHFISCLRAWGRKAAAPAASDSPCSSLSISPALGARPQQQTRRMLLQRANGTDGRTDGRRADAKTLPHTMRPVSKGERRKKQ